MSHRCLVLILGGCLLLGCRGDDSDVSDDRELDEESNTDVPSGADAVERTDGYGTDAELADAAALWECSGGTGIDWVKIPSGTFQMGTDLYPSERIHSVTLLGFGMSRTEVTACQYVACVLAGACATNYQLEGDEPLSAVDWDESRAFCLWAGGRLCSEAEWEYAARNGCEGTTFPWGSTDATCENAVCKAAGCAPSAPSTVCSKPKGNNIWDVCDLAGNVWEWVEDDYSKDYLGAPVDGSALVMMPRGSLRVFRGGCFVCIAHELQGAVRGPAVPSTRAPFVGARCCKTL